MKQSRKFSIRKIDKSFKFAFEGYKTALKTEPNMKLHSFAAILVVVCGIIFKISKLEWIFLISIIGLVIGAELLNTAIEHLVDLATQEYKIKAKIAKDTAAAYVMVLSFTAVIVGAIIFLPKIIEIIRVIVK